MAVWTRFTTWKLLLFLWIFIFHSHKPGSRERHRATTIFSSGYVGMKWEWRDKEMPGASRNCHTANTLGYRPMVTGPQRHNGIPRRCLFRTRLASRVSTPDNTHTLCLCLCLSQRKMEWRGVGREGVGLSYVLCPRSWMWLPCDTCWYSRFLQVERKR